MAVIAFPVPGADTVHEAVDANQALLQPWYADPLVDQVINPCLGPDDRTH